MNIKIEEVVGGFRADFTELSGSPLIGSGKTKEEAVATLFIRNLDNLDKLDKNYLYINGNPYEDYIKYDR